MNTGKICSASQYLYLTDHALDLPYHTHPFKIIFLSLLSNCTKSLQKENVIRLVRVILRIMLKTGLLDSKTTRTYCRKFIHSSILLYHIPSLICYKELQYPTGKWTCDSNFEFSVLVAARRWQRCCSQCFTCQSMEPLLLPTKYKQLCI